VTRGWRKKGKKYVWPLLRRRKVKKKLSSIFFEDAVVCRRGGNPVRGAARTRGDDNEKERSWVTIAHKKGRRTREKPNCRQIGPMGKK